ncbi:MAG: hypothetical protein ACJAU0_000809 [Flavobacteriales bacterium]|jgi:hypothetical protein
MDFSHRVSANGHPCQQPFDFTISVFPEERCRGGSLSVQKKVWVRAGDLSETEQQIPLDYYLPLPCAKLPIKTTRPTSTL